jgi:hypothetical protein
MLAWCSLRDYGIRKLMRAPEGNKPASTSPCLDPGGSRPWRQKVPGNANKARATHSDQSFRAGPLEKAVLKFKLRYEEGLEPRVQPAV